MQKSDLEKLWSETLRSERPDADQFDRLAQAVVSHYSSGDPEFRRHITNRSGQVAERASFLTDAENFTIESARAYVADEIGFKGWNELVDALRQGSVLFQYTIAAMERGDFSALESTIGPENFHRQIIAWFQSGLFETEQETLAEVLSAACMLGQTETAEYLIDQGVDPYAGMRTWLAGPHYAVSSGRLETVKMLLAKRIPMEIENRYGGTLLGQALWSARNEHVDTHAEIVALLVDAGAHVWPGTFDWWNEQEVPNSETKRRIAETLSGHV